MTFKFPLSHYIVYGNSMWPTLKPGMHVFSFNYFLNPKIGDIVVMRFDKKDIIKRVKKVEQDKLYVVGDNPKESTDSRDFGWVKKSKIVGKIFWSINS